MSSVERNAARAAAAAANHFLLEFTKKGCQPHPSTFILKAIAILLKVNAISTDKVVPNIICSAHELAVP